MWHHCPKDDLAGAKDVEVSENLTAVRFNDGTRTTDNCVLLILECIDDNVFFITTVCFISDTRVSYAL